MPTPPRCATRFGGSAPPSPDPQPQAGRPALSSYDETRPLIRSGDLLAWSKNDFASRAIRCWTGETWEHVGIAWCVGDRIFVIESTVREVRIRPLSMTAPFDWIKTNAPWSPQVEAVALADLGKRYSWGNIVRLALGLDPDRDGVVCSLKAGEILRACGFAVERKGLTPGHLVGLFLTAGAPLQRVV